MTQNHISLLLGDDAYLKSRVKRNWLSHVPPEAYDFDFEKLTVKDCDFARVLNSIGLLPMIASARSLIVEDIHKLTKDEMETWVKALERCPETTRLLMTADSLDKRLVASKNLLKMVKLVECELPPPWEWPTFVVKMAKENDFEIDTPTAQALVDASGKSLEWIETQLQTLKLFKHPHKRAQLQDVQALGLAGLENESLIFKIAEFIAQRQLGSAWQAGNELRHFGQPIQKIIPLIAKHFKQLGEIQGLSHLSDGEIAKLTSSRDFVIKKMRGQAQRFNSERMKRIYAHLNEHLTLLRTISNTTTEDTLFYNLIHKLTQVA